jgi:hypothetical protein
MAVGSCLHPWCKRLSLQCRIPIQLGIGQWCMICSIVLSGAQLTSFSFVLAIRVWNLFCWMISSATRICYWKCEINQPCNITKYWERKYGNWVLLWLYMGKKLQNWWKLESQQTQIRQAFHVGGWSASETYFTVNEENILQSAVECAHGHPTSTAFWWRLEPRKSRFGEP